MIKYDKLWETMKEKGITQVELAEAMGLSKGTIAMWEVGKRRLRHNKNVQVNTIDKLCNILECDVEDIMTHVHDNNLF